MPPYDLVLESREHRPDMERQHSPMLCILFRLPGLFFGRVIIMSYLNIGCQESSIYKTYRRQPRRYQAISLNLHVRVCRALSCLQPPFQMGLETLQQSAAKILDVSPVLPVYSLRRRCLCRSCCFQESNFGIYRRQEAMPIM